MHPSSNPLARLGLYVRLEARPGKESAVAEFLAGALPLAQEELGTTTWFAVKLGPSTFAVFDSFADEAGRQAHLTGKIAAALMANAGALLASPPDIEKWEALAVKLPK
jgi:quinol monooxygenase YgiN